MRPFRSRARSVARAWQPTKTESSQSLESRQARLRFSPAFFLGCDGDQRNDNPKAPALTDCALQFRQEGLRRTVAVGEFKSKAMFKQQLPSRRRLRHVLCNGSERYYRLAAQPIMQVTFKRMEAGQHFVGHHC
jgi:hypothetical protein